MEKQVNEDRQIFELHTKSDGIYLRIQTSSDGLVGTILQDIIYTLERNRIYNYPLSQIKKALQFKNKETEIKVSDPMDLPIMDEEINIEISSNKMYAAISFLPPQKGGKKIQSNQIQKALQEKGICFGMDMDLINTLEQGRKYYHKYLIATGKEPLPGKDGYLAYHFATTKDVKPEIKEDGSVDFHNLDLIENVKKGQVLVTLYPPEKGVPGKNVFGEEVASLQGKPTRLPQGKNTSISEDGTQLIAAIDGQVIVFENKVNVKEIYEVPANVGPSTGNINFVGTVIVKGNVLTGFSIQSGGNIEVYGVVEGANLTAEGDIILHRGIQGMGRGKLQANGNVIAKYIENSYVEAQGEVRSEAIMHSFVKSGISICVEGKRGLIVGGVLRAGYEIVAKTIGSSMATVTELEVGLDPSILEQFRFLKENVKKLEKECKQIEQAISLLTRLQEAGELSEAKRDLLIKSTKTKIYLQQQILSTRNEMDQLLPLLEVKALGKVKALKLIYPGVKVTIGTISMYVREDIQYCTLYQDQGEIKVDVYR